MRRVEAREGVVDKCNDTRRDIKVATKKSVMTLALRFELAKKLGDFKSSVIVGC